MEWVGLVRPLAMARLSSRQVPSHAFGQRAYYRGGRRIATKGEGRWDTPKTGCRLWTARAGARLFPL